MDHPPIHPAPSTQNPPQHPPQRTASTTQTVTRTPSAARHVTLPPARDSTSSGSGSSTMGEVNEKGAMREEGSVERHTGRDVIDNSNSNSNEKTTSSTIHPIPSPSHSEKEEDETGLPQLHFSFRWTSVLSYIAFLIFCNLLIPCLLFYLLRNFTSMTPKEIIGISSAALGLSSCFDAPFRLYRLVKYRTFYGPLGSDTWWHLDFVMWTYTFALFVFAFPLAIAPAIPLYNFFLLSTPLLVLPIGIVFFYSLLEPILPVRCSSEPSGNPMKPAAFYVLEDVGAVDFKLGRGWRSTVHDRYRLSPPFRSLLRLLTLYWTIQTLIYTGLTAAVTWASPLQFAFGWTLGQFFLWAFVAAMGNVWIVKRGLRRERAWFVGGGRGSVERGRRERRVRFEEEGSGSGGVGGRREGEVVRA